MALLPEGMLLVDKPKGLSSFDVIRRLRRIRNIKKMGHAGTLDPLATGLMIIAEGSATKLLSNYIKLDKTYEAEVCLGERSGTGDAEGEVLESVSIDTVDTELLRKVAHDMVGPLELPVPVYSAIKQDGERLYKKARKGEHVTPPTRTMRVMETTYLDSALRNGLVFVTLRFHVGSGTYIRSLAEEYGRRLGYPARLENLRRTQVGEYSIEDAMALDSFAE